MKVIKTQKINWCPLSNKHIEYIQQALRKRMSVAEGAIRSGKTIDHCIIAFIYLDVCPDKLHLASGSTIANAKTNIGDCNGFGLEHLFRGRCRWGKYKDNEALYINSSNGEKVVIFAGGGKADSYKKILGNSYGLWLATEINEHYDCDDSKTSFIKVAMGRQASALRPMTLWDLNPSNPDASIYKDYIDKYLIEGLVGGYNYQHFTIADNLSITEQRRKEIESMYNPNSLWYRRDILGERIILQGLCHEYLANNRNDFYIELDKFQHRIASITIGVDFGGNQSATTFCATAILRGMREIVVLGGKRIKKSLTPLELENEFNDFCKLIYEQFNVSLKARCDSEESVLINGIRVSSAKNFGRCQILNAIKGRIKNRILLTEKLVAKKRIWFYKNGFGVDEILNSLCKSTYDPKAENSDERLDIVSYENPIDMVDAFEYSIEEYNNALTQLNSVA